MSGEEKVLEQTIDSGPFEGKTYKEIQAELDQYADDVMFFNEMLRSAKKDGHRVMVVSDEEKAEIQALAQQVANREGQMRILPNWGKEPTKQVCDYLVNYKVITPEQAELLFNYRFLITKEQHFQMMMIRGSKRYQDHIRQLRCNCFYFVRASALDNIDILCQTGKDGRGLLLCLRPRSALLHRGRLPRHRAEHNSKKRGKHRWRHEIQHGI